MKYYNYRLKALIILYNTNTNLYSSLPISTPIPTPAVTPATSPTRETKGKGAIKKSKHEGSGIVLLVKRDIFFSAEPSNRALKREVQTEEVVKYIYVNTGYRP